MAILPRNATEPNWKSFAPITPYNHAGYLWVAALYCIIVSSLVFVTRAWIKRKTWGHDDTVFAMATAAQVGHVAAIFVSLEHGLGRVPGNHTQSKRADSATEASQYAEGGRAVFAALIFFILALALTKCSVVFFLQRLLGQRSHKIFFGSMVLLVVFTLWGLAAIITAAVDCDPSGFIMDTSAQLCGDQERKWAGIAAFDALTELLIIILPIAIVTPLQMSWKLKAQVIAAFFFRIGVAAVAIIHAIYVARYEKSVHPSLAMIPAIVIAEAELCWSLVSATLPNLKNFMKSFSTGFGHEFGQWSIEGSSYFKKPPRQSRRAEEIPMTPLTKSDKSRSKLVDSSTFVSDQRDTRYDTMASGDRNADARSLGGGGSQEMIIRKDVTMSVEYAQKQRKKGLF